MKSTIENQFLKVSIQKVGAEICSIKSKKTDKEYMWEANPEVWGSYAPVLFPIIGSLKNNKYTYKGVSYTVPKHGFIRNNSDLVFNSESPEQLTFSFKYNEDTLKMYPFKFIFSISFQLIANKLEINHKVENLGANDMLFSIGGHPGFKCPINSDENYEDYYLEFENIENESTWELNAMGLTTGKTHKVLENTDKLPLTKSLFNTDALIFKNLKSRKVSLKNNLNNDGLTMTFQDFNYLGIWAKPNAPFVCIEPWLGITDDENISGDLEKKEGMLRLGSGKTFNVGYAIEIKD